MRADRLRTTLTAAALLVGLAAAPLAFAGGHGYPPTVSASSSEAREYGWSSQRDGYVQDDGYAEHREYGERGGYRERAWSSHDRGDVDDGLAAPVVGYLPVSFFGDAGGVGPYAIDGGYGGGGGYVYASGGAFAGTRASASVSASIGIHGGFHGGGHGGGHHGGGHGCGCK
jgi:hypothetical protein